MPGLREVSLWWVEMSEGPCTLKERCWQTPPRRQRPRHAASAADAGLGRLRACALGGCVKDSECPAEGSPCGCRELSGCGDPPRV